MALNSGQEWQECCPPRYIGVNMLGCDRRDAFAVSLTSGLVPPILLFNGTGTSPNDVAVVETLLESQIRGEVSPWCQAFAFR